MIQDTATYVCDACGEEIDLVLDHSAGMHQQFVDDCPVCCRPNVISVEFDAEGNPSVRNALEY